MKRIIIACLLFLFPFVVVEIQAQTRISISVIGSLDENYNRLLANKMVQAFSKSSEYVAVNRSASLNEVIKQTHALQRNGNIDYTQVVNAAKQYGETQLCIVDVFPIENVYEFSATLIDLQKNTVSSTASTECIISELNVQTLVEISNTLTKELVPGLEHSNSDLSTIQKKAEVDLAKQNVEKNKKYNISYAAFKQEFVTADKWGNRRETDVPAAEYYLNKSAKTFEVGHYLWFIPPCTALLIGTVCGVASFENEKLRVPIAIGCCAASMIPVFSCYIAAGAYKRQAWKAYRQPYMDALDEYNKAAKTKQIGLQISPAIGYDWAGAQVRISF